MNQRNMDALQTVISEYMPIPGTVVFTAGIKGLAQFLASRGVLVPSALTEEETVQVFLASSVGRDRMFWERPFKEALERLAKGEP